MSILKSSLVAVALLAGFAAPSRAQDVSRAVSNGGFATFPGAGVNTGYYSINSGFGNYDLPGTYPGYSGFALSGYGPGATLDAYFTASRPYTGPQTTNATNGLIKTIRTQTGKGTSNQLGGFRGAVAPRRPR